MHRQGLLCLLEQGYPTSYEPSTQKLISTNYLSLWLFILSYPLKTLVVVKEDAKRRSSTMQGTTKLLMSAVYLTLGNSIAIKSSNPFGVWLYLFLWPYHYLQAHKGHDHNIFSVSLLKFCIKVGALAKRKPIAHFMQPREVWNYIIYKIKDIFGAPLFPWPFYFTMFKKK